MSEMSPTATSLIRQLKCELDLKRAEVARLESELSDANYWRERHANEATAYGKQSVQNFDRAKRFETALKFYADEANGDDEGKTAREALHFERTQA